MTVVLTGYLKSHPAMKQESQLQKVEQSATTIKYVRYGRRFIFWKVFDIESCNVIVRYFLWA